MIVGFLRTLVVLALVLASVWCWRQWADTAETAALVASLLATPLAANELRRWLRDSGPDGWKGV